MWNPETYVSPEVMAAIRAIDADLISSPHINYVKEAQESRARSLETAIRNFYDCGVTLDRMEIHETRDFCQSTLCVDGVPRFTWRLVFPDHIN